VNASLISPHYARHTLSHEHKHTHTYQEMRMTYSVGHTGTNYTIEGMQCGEMAANPTPGVFRMRGH